MIALPPRFVIILALLAVLVRAMIPMGYMPDPGRGKTFQMTICSMEGPKTVTVDDKFHPVNDHHEIAKDHCPFSIASHSPYTVAMDQLTIDAPYQIATLQQLKAHDQFMRFHVYDNAAQPRAPPVIV